MESKLIETLSYGVIDCIERYDIESGETFIDMYEANNSDGYYGELWGVSLDDLDSDIVEEQITENLYG